MFKIYNKKIGKYKLFYIKILFLKLSIIILTIKKVSFRLEIEWGWNN